MILSSLDQEPTIFTVTELNREVKMVLENNLAFVWVEGEISNFAAPQSGHWYFSLKDQGAQVRCAMFKGQTRKVDFVAKDGMHVLIKARVSVYETRGEYQLIVDFMEERGEGKLKRAFETLKKKLEAEGLFDVKHKKPLPALPKQIGIITSSTGAALRDILHVLQRRFPIAAIVIYPTLVQGTEAAAQIVRAITIANTRNECDVLILARGGGSLEDLWPFNEEIVARAIFASTLPIISGVGHEIDFTIADFVADQRAPTPSAAAELSVPDTAQLLHVLQKQLRLLQKPMLDLLNRKTQETDWLEKRLLNLHPKKQVQEKSERLKEAMLTLQRLQKHILINMQATIKQSHMRLLKQSPIEKIFTLTQLTQRENENLHVAMVNTLHQLKLSLAETAARMDTLSPLATLKRGFSIPLDAKKQIIRSVNDVSINDSITIKINDGELDCLVQDKR